MSVKCFIQYNKTSNGGKKWVIVVVHSAVKGGTAVVLYN